MAALCRDLAKNLPTGKPPRSYLLDLAISYEQAGDSVYAFAGAKPNVSAQESRPEAAQHDPNEPGLPR